MNRILYIFTLLLVANVPSSAKLIAEMKDGTYRTLEAETFEETAGQYSISGIPVPQIKCIYNNLLIQPAEGTHIDIPQAVNKPAVVLDINARVNIDEDGENGRHLYSAKYMLDLAGVPYFVTESLDEALQGSSFVLITNPLGTSTFSAGEYGQIRDWVAAGGVLIAPAIETTKDQNCLDLFGVSAVTTKQKTHTFITWVNEPLAELAYIDTDEERETYIGRNYIFTTTYEPGTATTLAKYDQTDDAAVIKHTIGAGAVYSIGVRWRDVIQRAQLNKGGTNRVKNNHYDPSADVYPLFVRACYVANNDVAVWKHTIPSGYETVLIPTHDCDSKTALLEMHWMGDYEHSLGLNAHYFITTHYFRHPNYMSAFYNENTILNIREIYAQGHTVGSHSVCHFPDFNVTARFPLTVTTPEEYEQTCTFDPDTKVSSGGSTWAEVVMSKQLLERDIHNTVRAFRSGHLCMNANIPDALEMGDYSFSSCYTAPDLGTEFPFFIRRTNSWTGDLLPILEMPLHISDVSPTGDNMGEDNWMEAPAIWYEYHKKSRSNYSPNILLIHPNKEWKMEVQKMYIEMLDLNKVGLYNFQDYGDFWIKRLDFDYSYALTDGQLVVKVNADDLSQYRNQGLVLETASEVSSIAVTNSRGEVHTTRIANLSDSRIVIIL